jgi:ABC-type sugar transport system substrate-binding protein
VLIAVIGKRWLISSEAEGSRRLDNPDDFVRLEIATALKRNIRVIPVLVDDASVPRASDLPDDLKSLVRRNAVEVSHTRFGADSERLIAALERVFEKTAAEQREREEKARLEAERSGREKKEPLETERPTAKTEEHLKPSHQPKQELGRREQLPLSSSGATPRKSPSKQIVVFLAIAAVLVVGGLIYLAVRASQSLPSQPAPLAAVTPSSAETPSPPAIAKVSPIAIPQPSIANVAQKKLISVAVTVGDLGNPFFVQIAHGAQVEAKKINPSVKFSAEPSNYDVNDQTNQMDNFTVVAVDVGAEGGVDATVTSNNKQAGELDGKYVADRLKGKGNVVIVNGPHVTAVIDRVAGFLGEVKKYPDIKILSQDQNAGGSRDGGRRVMSDLLTAFKKIDAVFAINDSTAIGCDLAAKQAQRKDFFIVGGRWSARYCARTQRQG